MINFKMTINDTIVDNQYILDSIEFTTESGMQDYTVGGLFIPCLKTKLHNDVNIAYSSTVEIFLIDEDGTEIPYGIFEPYEIKQSNLYRELTLYPQLYFSLNETYTPTQDTLTTRTLLQNMQLRLGFLVENIDDLDIVDMNGLKADSAMNLLKDIALVSATNIIINRTGKIEFKRITSNSTLYAIDGSNITELVKSDTFNYQITQVVGKVDDNSETEQFVCGYPTNTWNTLTITSQYMNQTVANNIYNATSTVSYSGFELKIFNAPINLEVLDKLQFTYKNESYTIPVMDMSIAYSRGGLVAKIKANVSAEVNKSNSGAKGSITSKIEVIKNITQELNTKVNIQDGQIDSLISQTTIIEDGQTVTLKDKYSQIKQDINGITLQVGTAEQKIEQLQQTVENGNYQILLTQEHFIFNSDANGEIFDTQQITTEVIAYKGNVEIENITIGDLPQIDGLTLSKEGKVITIVANKGTLLADNGFLEIPIIIDENRYIRKFSWAKSKRDDSSKYVNVTGDQVFRYVNGIPTPSILTLTAQKHGITSDGKWQYKNLVDEWVDWQVNGLVVTDTTLTINPYDKLYADEDVKLLQVRYIIDTIYDEFTTYKISDAQENTLVFLSNENHSFPCESDGTILRDIGTYSQVLALRGNSLIPAKVDISKIDVPSGMMIKVYNNTQYAANETGELITETSDTVVDETGNVIEYAYLSPEGIMEVVYYNVTDEDANNIADEYDNILISESGIWLEFIALGVNNNQQGYYVTDEDIKNISDEERKKLVSEGLLDDTINSSNNFKIGTLADNGTVIIPIEVDGFTFNKVFSWSKARKGEQGATANSASIVATSQVFKSKDGKVFTPETITLKPILHNVRYAKWQYSTNGGNRWIDVTNNKNGITIQNGELTLDNDSNLFTETTTSIVFKLLTTDINVYDTITISRLSDGNLDEIKVGIRNLLSKTGTKIKLLGYGEDNQLEDIYYLVSGNSTELMGKTITFSCDYEASAGTYGYMSIRTNGQPHENASVGYFELLSDVISLNDSFQGHITKTLTLSDDQSLGFTGIQLCLNNVVGDITISNCILTLGDVQVTWVPAPEDGTDYTSELINELRLIDLQEIIKQNQESSNRIDQILGDNVVTSTEKVDLVYDYDRATMSKESATNYYYSVNDATMNPLRLSMEEAYEKLTGVMIPILEDMNSDTEIKTDVIKNAFSVFYQAYEALMMALQSSVLIVITKYGTKIEQLDERISLTASKTEVMEDKVNQVDSHFDFTQAGFVEIYATTNGTKGRFATQITDQKLAFKDYGQEVAYISNQEMYITKATITNQLDISRFSIKPSGKGGIMFIYKED